MSTGRFSTPSSNSFWGTSWYAPPPIGVAWVDIEMDEDRIIPDDNEREEKMDLGKFLTGCFLMHPDKINLDGNREDVGVIREFAKWLRRIMNANR